MPPQRRRRPSTLSAMITLKRGGTSRSFHLSAPALAALVLVTFVITSGFLATSAFLTFKDDLLTATLSRQARIMQAYEDRIAALRTQVDLVTSRQLLDQQAVERRVALLLARQEKIGSQAVQIRRAFGQMDASDSVDPTTTGTVTTPKSPKRLRLGSLIGSNDPFGGESRAIASLPTLDQPTDAIIASLEETLKTTEARQLASLRTLRQDARRKAMNLASILQAQGIRLPEDTAVGGPLIEVNNGRRFTDSVSALESSLESLEKVRRAAKHVPHGSPAPGNRISSHFGNRRDPFTGRRALHGGLDFRGNTGDPVFATGSGKVVKAGRRGGYGKLVVIDHGGGITTRYAHLSRIMVKKGQRVTKGTRIGKIGSTGRSTGPHLHYEVRRNKRVLDPIRYVRLEKKLKPYL